MDAEPAMLATAQEGVGEEKSQLCWTESAGGSGGGAEGGAGESDGLANSKNIILALLRQVDEPVCVMSYARSIKIDRNYVMR